MWCFSENITELAHLLLSFVNSSWYCPLFLIITALFFAYVYIVFAVNKKVSDGVLIIQIVLERPLILNNIISKIYKNITIFIWNKISTFFLLKIHYYYTIFFWFFTKGENVGRDVWPRCWTTKGMSSKIP